MDELRVGLQVRAQLEVRNAGGRLAVPGSARDLRRFRAGADPNLTFVRIKIDQTRQFLGPRSFAVGWTCCAPTF